MDLTPAFVKVKLSHVEFLIWYLMRLALQYLPFNEVSTSVRRSLFGQETSVVSASIANLDNCNSPSLAVTDLFRVWFLAAHRAGQDHIELGSRGKLDKLKDAADFWVGEHTGKVFALGRTNELRIVLNVRGSLSKWEIRFDDQMRINLPYGDPEAQIDGRHVIVMEDSEFLLDFADFKRVILDFSIVGDILNRSYLVATAAWHLDACLIKQPSESGTYLSIKCNLLLSSPQSKETETRLGYVQIDSGDVGDVPPEANPVDIDHLLCDKNQFFFPKSIIPSLVVKVASLQTKTLKELVTLALKHLNADLIDNGKSVKLGSSYKYCDASLELLKAQAEYAKVLITGRGERKAAKTLEIKLEDVWMHFKSGGDFDRNSLRTLELDILFDQRQLRQVCCYYTRDYYSMGGISMATDQLVPCQLGNKNDQFGDIFYENTGICGLIQKK